MNLSDNLKKIRKENNLSQENLAEKLGVSRQAVSKWESNQAYPEMDKVIQICNMFNLNIDELLNQNIKEVKSNKQFKNSINKYIDDFLSFITKTIEMLNSMKFKDKIKCILEQIFIFGLSFLIGIIIGSVLSHVFFSIFSFIPGNIFYPIYKIFEGLYLLALFILCFVIVLHIFKTRYLDYYVLDIKEDDEESDITNDDDNKKVKFVKKEEKIIIRDPKHSNYRFISGLIKVIIFMFKIFILFIGMFFCLSLVGFSILLVLSFMFIKTGLIFVGILLSLIASIVINLVILDIIYSFIISKKINKTIIGFVFFISLIVFGIGIGLFMIGFKDFKVLDEYDKQYITRDEKVIDMNNNLIINSYDVEYIESDNKDVKIVCDHANITKVSFYNYNNIYEVYNSSYFDDYREFKYILENASNKVFVSPDYFKLYVYTTKENINILKENRDKYYNKMRVEETNNRVRELNEEINSLNSKNNALKADIESKNVEINDLKEKNKRNEEVITELRNSEKLCENN